MPGRVGPSALVALHPLPRALVLWQVADEAVVILASILESELTISYEAACVGRHLTKFNGEAAPALNLRALAAAVHRAGSAPFLKFEFGERCAVLETAQSRKTEVHARGMRMHMHMPRRAASAPLPPLPIFTAAASSSPCLRSHASAPADASLLLRSYCRSTYCARTTSPAGAPQMSIPAARLS